MSKKITIKTRNSWNPFIVPKTWNQCGSDCGRDVFSLPVFFPFSYRMILNPSGRYKTPPCCPHSSKRWTVLEWSNDVSFIISNLFQRKLRKDRVSSGKVHVRVDYSGFCKWHEWWQQQHIYVSALLERGLTSRSECSSIRAKLRMNSPSSIRWRFPISEQNQKEWKDICAVQYSHVSYR